MSDARPPCFHEIDRDTPLVRRASVEGLGTALLVFAASAAGIAANRLLPQFPAAAALFIAPAVAGALVALIVAFGKLSGGHYNPLITLSQLLAGERSRYCTLAYIGCQLAGGALGGLLSVAVWHAGAASGQGLGIGGMSSEFVASLGLLLIVMGSARSGRTETGPFAVAAWLFAAVLATPTGSYANPAVVLGATLASGPIALSAGSALAYVVAQIGGAVVALAIISLVLPRPDGRS